MLLNWATLNSPYECLCKVLIIAFWRLNTLCKWRQTQDFWLFSDFPSEFTAHTRLFPGQRGCWLSAQSFPVKMSNASTWLAVQTVITISRGNVINVVTPRVPSKTSMLWLECPVKLLKWQLQLWTDRWNSPTALCRCNPKDSPLITSDYYEIDCSESMDAFPNRTERVTAD